MQLDTIMLPTEENDDGLKSQVYEYSDAGTQEDEQEREK